MLDLKALIEQYLKDTEASANPKLNTNFEVITERAKRMQRAFPLILKAILDNSDGSLQDAIEEIKVHIATLNAEVTDLYVELAELKTLLENVQGNNSSAGEYLVDSNEQLIGARDGANKLFTTRHTFLPGTTRVFLNGARQFPGLDSDYVEVDERNILMIFPLQATDNLTIEYITEVKTEFTFVSDYDIIGVKDGTNRLFTTNAEYVSQTVEIYLNGLRLTRGTDNDYVEIDTRNILLHIPPADTDNLIVDYKTQIQILN